MTFYTTFTQIDSICDCHRVYFMLINEKLPFCGLQLTLFCYSKPCLCLSEPIQLCATEYLALLVCKTVTSILYLPKNEVLLCKIFFIESKEIVTTSLLIELKAICCYLIILGVAI